MTSLRNIVEGGYCIGCGACNAVSHFEGDIRLDPTGMYKPSCLSQTKEVETQVLKICPFSDEGPNEDVISNKLYQEVTNYSKEIGHYNGLYAGHVSVENFREIGTSGGVITWLLSKLISSGAVDYVIHVKASKGSTLFNYGISSTIEQVKDGAKSRYYPVEISDVMRTLKRIPGRYAFVGLPCFIKSVRRLCETDSIIASRITYCVGLICGHLKSTGFAEFFAWQLGVPPSQLKSIDFRVKLPELPANSYGVEVASDFKKVAMPTKKLLGSNWGHNLFRNPACNYCDDVFAETADVCVGDAWLDEYKKDWRGTSVVVTRDQTLKTLFEQAIESGELTLDDLSLEQVLKSQGSGITDRREGLSYRLYLKQTLELWTPKKRVPPSQIGISRSRKKIYQLRERSSNDSHSEWRKAKQINDLDTFISYFEKFNIRYEKQTLPFRKRFKRSVKRIVKQLTGQLRRKL